MNGIEAAARNAKRHLAEHRASQPRRIDLDDELRAFILKRINHMSFPKLAAAVATHFPRDRHVSHATIHRWWQARCGRR